MSLSRLAKNKYLIGTFLLFFNLILISVQIPPGSHQSLLEKVFFAAFSPLQKAAVSTYNYLTQSWKNIVFLKKAQRENQELKKQIFFLYQERDLLLEQFRLRLAEQQLENNLQWLETSVLPARVIGLDTANYFRSLVIDRGSDDGVVKNLPVCDHLGRLLGKTTEPVSSHTAKVSLITSEDSGVAVLSATDRMPGILSGDGQGMCLIKYIMASSPGGIIGDEILTSGFDQIFPAGLKVGKIISVANEVGLFKKIKVEPYFNFKELTLVAILKNSPELKR
ncbi:MAG: rod shape-determining protein MreC [Acidobacteriota bacterium]|nr:rod shape-determining protein MreC [Acidobacteriota bacterium]